MVLLVGEGRGFCPNCLLRPKCPTFDLPFGLEPIVQVTAVFLAAFNVELVRPMSDLRLKRRVSRGALCSLFSDGGFNRLEFFAPVSRWFRCHTYFLSG